MQLQRFIKVTGLLSALAIPAGAQCELQELVPGVPGSYYGRSAALDGDVAVIGAHQSVYVFERGPSAWNETAFLPAPDSFCDYFGGTVAVDGDRIVVGDPFWDYPMNQGMMFLFERQGANWVYQHTLQQFPMDDDMLGFDLDIDGDFVVGGNGCQSGCPVWLFKLLPGGGYTTEFLWSADFAWPGYGGGFGNSVAIDGDWIAVGGPEAGLNGGPNDEGHVFLYQRVAGSWFPSQYFAASDAYPGMHFGTHVDLDSGRLLVGIHGAVGPERTYVYEEVGGTWVETGVLETPQDDGLYWSSQVAIAGDAALIASRGDGLHHGAGWLFEPRGGNWERTSKFGAVDPPTGSSYVNRLALSETEAVIAGGGKAWIFDLVGGRNSNYCTSTPNSTGAACTITHEGSVSITRNAFTLAAFDCVPGQFGLFFFGPSRIQLPFGDGFRCVGGAVTRLNPALQIDATGVARYLVDFTSPPASAIVPGGSPSFQFWYRDPAAAGAGFNLSDGLTVSFCP